MESSNRASMQQLLRGRAKSALTIVGAWTVFGILATAHFFLAGASDEASTFLEYAEHIAIFNKQNQDYLKFLIVQVL